MYHATVVRDVATLARHIMFRIGLCCLEALLRSTVLLISSFLPLIPAPCAIWASQHPTMSISNLLD